MNGSGSGNGNGRQEKVLEEIKLRGMLLGSNKELLQLHRTLVRGGLITEEEFWESRQVNSTLFFLVLMQL